jgi:hypothetical protein
VLEGRAGAENALDLFEGAGAALAGTLDEAACSAG